MKKTALLLVITMLVSVFAGYGAVFAETTEVVNGPQEGAFSVSATEATTLSGVRFTKTNASDGSWSNGLYCALEAYSYTQRYVSYDLDVEKAGAYRVTVKAVAYSDGIIARLYRQGKMSQSTGDLGGGDVVLAEAGLKSTDGVWSPQDNDFGVIYLEEGTNQLAISSLTLCAKSFYFISMTLTPVEESAPLVFGLRDAVEMNADETFNGSIQTHAVPYISFGVGDYQLYEVTIPSDGLYSFTAYGSYSHELTLTDVTDAENPVELVTDAVTASTGTGSSASPAEAAKINLTAGTYTYKLTNDVSSHYSYFTLKKVADSLGDKVTFLPTGETVKIDRTLYSVSTGGTALDFGYGGYREYKVYAETEGYYDFILNYATTGSVTMSLAVDGTVKANKALDTRSSWGDYADVTVGTIKLNAGLNTLKLTPGGGEINMPYFTLAPSVIASFNASECANVTTDALTTMSANGGTAVKLSEGQKLDFTFTAPADALYDFTVTASVTMGKRLVYISEGENDLLDAEITGEPHGNWKSIYIGSVELTEGEHSLSFRLDEGYDSYFDIISITSEEIEVPETTAEPTETPTEAPTAEPSGKGPQETAFPVSASEATTLTANYYTKASVSGVTGWYDKQNFATLDVATYTHHFVSYELDVEKAGAYRVTASISAPSVGSVAQLVRRGKNVSDTETNSYAVDSGDVVLSKASLIKTAASTSPATNDFGVIWLDEGTERIAIANDRDGGKAFYYFSLTLTPVEEDAPIVVSVRDAKELTASDGSAKTIYGYATTFTAIAPYIQFFAGDYQLYDVNIPSDGLYSFTTFQGGANVYTLTDVTDSENPVTLANADVPTNGDSQKASPFEVAQLSLTAGVHTLKLSASQSNHYSYFTLRKIGEIPTVEAVSLPVGENVKVSYGKYTEFKHSAGLDFTDVDPDTGDIVESWREYTVNAEQAGDYQLIVNYATPDGAGIIIEVNGEEIAAEGLDATETYADYTDYEIPYVLPLNEGINVIRLIPEGTFNMPHFVLNQLSAEVYDASAASNVAADSLVTVSYNGTTSVKLNAGQKLDFTVVTEKAGFYVMRSLVSATTGLRTVSVSVDGEAALTSAVKGQQHSEYENETLGIVYLKEGENALTLTLDAGYCAYFNNISVGSVSAKLYSGEEAVSGVSAGDLTAKVDLAGLYAGETKTVYFAVYEKNAQGAVRLAYINMEDKKITDGEEVEITVSGIVKTAGCTYTAKVFVLDNLSGFYHEF